MKKRRLFLCLCVLLCYINLDSKPGTDTAFLKTAHFIVNYYTDETPYAVEISEIAESYYRQLEVFFNSPVDDVISLSLLGNDRVFAFSGRQISLNYSPAMDTQLLRDDLYGKIFSYFFIEAASETFGKALFKSEIRSLEKDLCSYSQRGLSRESRLILRSFLTEDVNRYSGLLFRDYSNLNSTIRESVYHGFFYYIETVFGRRILQRSLKDRIYYGGFLTALSAITGKSVSEIDNDYALFISAELSGTESTAVNYHFPDFTSDEDEIIDYTVSPDGLSIVTLVRKRGRFYIRKIIEKDGKTSGEIELRKGGVFKRIHYSGPDSFAVSGSTGNESFISVFSAESLLLKNTFQVTGIFIRDFSPIQGDGKFLLNTGAGISEDIMSADFNENSISRKAVQHLHPGSDIVYSGSSFFYIAKGDFNEIIEVKTADGSMETVLKINEDITSLIRSADGLVIAANSHFNGKVYLLDPVKQTLKVLLSVKFPVYRAQVSGNNLYCLTFYNNSKRIMLKKVAD